MAVEKVHSMSYVKRRKEMNLAMKKSNVRLNIRRLNFNRVNKSSTFHGIVKKCHIFSYFKV